MNRLFSKGGIHIRIIWIGCLLLFCGYTGVFANDDPFLAYCNSIPTIKRVISEESMGDYPNRIVVRKFIFNSRDHINEVYGIMAVPAGEGVFPAILFLHGGGGNAETVYGLVVDYARRGYVTMAIDLPGLCGANNTPYTNGIWKTVEKEKGMEEARIVGDHVEKSTLVDAEVAGMEAINYLTAQSKVNASKIGIIGFSWGGYSTTMLSGLMGGKVKAAYAVYGCGFYEKGSFWLKWIDALPEKDRQAWLTYLDAGRRAPAIKAAYFIEAASNDTFFWPPAVMATLKAIPGEKNHVWGVNLNHKQLPSANLMQQLYFDYHLKGVGKPFSKVSVLSIEKQKDGGKKVIISVDIPEGVGLASVKLYHSREPESKKWQEREWREITAGQISQNTFVVILPKNEVDLKVDFFISAEDNRGVITSCDIYNAAL